MREIKKHSTTTECIVLTGHSSQVSAIEAVKLGAYSYEKKPYEVEQLLITIRRAIEKKEAAEALAQEQRLLHALMDNIPDDIYFKNVDSRFIRINKAKAKRHGLSYPSEAVGKTDFDFFIDKHAQHSYTDEQEVMRTGQPIIRYRRKGADQTRSVF